MMLINVTQEHIDKGKRGSVIFCPVARAVREVFGDGVVASGAGILIKGYHHHVPHIVQEFMQNFDTTKPVKPFSFELETELEPHRSDH
jgi:hypothetical protein